MDTGVGREKSGKMLDGENQTKNSNKLIVALLYVEPVWHGAKTLDPKFLTASADSVMEVT